MTDPRSSPDATTRTPRDPSRRWATIPNALSLFRWLGSPLLIAIGAVGEARGFVLAYLVLALSDWIDGKIAVGWNQRSRLGARLDSFADATLYASLLIGGLLLWHDVLTDEWPWLVMAVGSYAVATVAGLIRFGRWPSYHTRSAKLSWGFMMAGVAGIAWAWSPWPLRIGLVSVTLANVESLVITLRSSRWRNDVIGFWVPETPPDADATASPEPSEQAPLGESAPQHARDNDRL